MGSIYFPHVVKSKRAPIATDDRSKGYVVGQVWIHENGTQHDFYICTNETENQAEWSNGIDKLADPDNPVWDTDDFISDVKENMGLGTAAFEDTGEVTGTIPVIGNNNKIDDKLINTHTIISDKSATGNIVKGSSIGTSSKRYAAMYADLLDALRANIVNLTVTGSANISGNTNIIGDLTVDGDIVGGEATFDKIIVNDGSGIEIDTAPSKPIDLNYITTYQILPNTTIGSSHTIGSSSAKFSSAYINVINSSNIKAKYYLSDNADIAERFYSDIIYPEGTIVSINSDCSSNNEITLAKKDIGVVLGVVSKNPAYELNSSLDHETSLPIAYFGRVNILIGGPIEKGQLVTMSITDGIGIAADDDDIKNKTFFAQSLETNEDFGAKLVMCVLLK